jgi:hypothetical protein
MLRKNHCFGHSTAGRQAVGGNLFCLLFQSELFVNVRVECRIPDTGFENEFFCYANVRQFCLEQHLLLFLRNLKKAFCE